MYSTVHQMFTCSCPAWLKSPFFLWKHLTRDQPVPLYRELIIGRTPSFIQICENTTRCRANIDGEEKLDFDVEPQYTSSGNDAPAAYHDIDYGINCTLEDRFDDLYNISFWLVAHVNELQTHQPRKEQLQYIRPSIMLCLH